MVERDKLVRLLDILRDNVSDLRRYATRFSQEDLARKRDAQHMVLHAMYVATQAMIDCANHVLADRGLPRAATYAAIFDRLDEADVLPAELCARLSRWASMRNVLAHFYPVIDMKRVHRALQDDVDDLQRFVDEVERLLD